MAKAKIASTKMAISIHRAIDPDKAEAFYVLQAASQHRIVLGPKIAIPIQVDANEGRISSRELGKEDLDALNRIIDLVESKSLSIATQKAEAMCKESGLELES